MAVGTKIGAAAWLEEVTPTDHLRDLAAGIASKSSSANSAWISLCTDSLDNDVSELRYFLSNHVCSRGLATFVHRLQRRSVGLSDDWVAFCRRKRQNTFDPHEVEPSLLLEFVCWSISFAPEKVAVVKGPFDSFMEVAVEVARKCMMGEISEATSYSHAGDMAGQLRAVLGIQCQQLPNAAVIETECDDRQCASVNRVAAQTKFTRPFDLKDDSTMSGSMPSKSDRSESGASDHEGHFSDNLDVQPASMRWLGPEPDSPQHSQQLVVPSARLSPR